MKNDWLLPWYLRKGDPRKNWLDDVRWTGLLLLVSVVTILGAVLI